MRARLKIRLSGDITAPPKQRTVPSSCIHIRLDYLCRDIHRPTSDIRNIRVVREGHFDCSHRKVSEHGALGHANDYRIELDCGWRWGGCALTLRDNQLGHLAENSKICRDNSRDVLELSSDAL